MNIILLFTLGLSFSSDFRINVRGITFTISEVVSLAYIVYAVFCLTSHKQWKIQTDLLVSITMLVAAIILSFPFSDDRAEWIRASRNFITPFMFFLLLASSKNRDMEKVAAFIGMITGGLISSGFGLYEAINDFDILPLRPDANLISEDLDKSAAIMSWKYDLGHTTLLPSIFHRLAVGLHTYSNVYAEYLLYVAVVIIGLMITYPRWRVLMLPCFALVLVALITSGSRTGLLGVTLVILASAVLARRLNMSRAAAILGFLITSCALIMSFGSLFTFDNFGTIRSRIEYADQAISLIVDPSAFLLGGNFSTYIAIEPQSPHNALIFIALRYGMLAAVAFVIVWSVVARRLLLAFFFHAASSQQICNARIALLALIWFTFYGMTWSVVESANSLLPLMFLMGIALAPICKDELHRAHVKRLGWADLHEPA